MEAEETNAHLSVSLRYCVAEKLSSVRLQPALLSFVNAFPCEVT